MATTTTPDDVAGALAAWLAQRIGTPVDVLGTPRANGDGFDSAIYFVQYVGAALPIEWQQPLVVRIKPRLEALEVARREAAIHGWLADHGYPTPRVLEVFEPGVITPLPTQVIVRAAGVTMFDAQRRRPWTIRRRLVQLAGLHSQLHRLPDDGFPDVDDLVDRRLALPRAVADDLGDAALGDALAAVEALAPQLRDAPSSVCHGDFHPLNVLVDGPYGSVIDWSDAGLGDRHGDVARTVLLFELATLMASSRPERAALRAIGPRMAATYRRAYEASLPLDPRRLALWRPAHLVHGWSQVLGAHNGRFDDDGGLADRLPPGLLGELQRRFAEAIAAV